MPCILSLFGVVLFFLFSQKLMSTVRCLYSQYFQIFSFGLQEFIFFRAFVWSIHFYEVELLLIGITFQNNLQKYGLERISWMKVKLYCNICLLTSPKGANSYWVHLHVDSFKRHKGVNTPQKEKLSVYFTKTKYNIVRRQYQCYSPLV